MLLAIDLDQHLTQALAGFAIKCTPPVGTSFYLPNRLTFAHAGATATTPGQEQATPSDRAPSLKIRWLHLVAGAIPSQYTVQQPCLPPFAVCCSPHTSANVVLDRVAEAIQRARSSVLFAVMELEGGGPVLELLRALPSREGIFSFLKGKVPQPFQAEYSGGLEEVIHHKFVVVDFNDTNPVVFASSSNQAKGGEQQNGDNLLALSDQTVAADYAVEVIQLVDHYQRPRGRACRSTSRHIGTGRQLVDGAMVGALLRPQQHPLA